MSGVKSLLLFRRVVLVGSDMIKLVSCRPDRLAHDGFHGSRRRQGLVVRLTRKTKASFHAPRLIYTCGNVQCS